MEWARSMADSILHDFIFFEEKSRPAENEFHNPKGIAADRRGCNVETDVPQPVPGSGNFVTVTQGSRRRQPWAECRNPFRIGGRKWRDALLRASVPRFFKTII